MSIKQYRNVIVRFSEVGDDSVLGDDVFITDSRIGRHCTVERRGMIFGSVLGDYSYTGYNTVVKSAEIGRFCSISWNISIGEGGSRFSRSYYAPVSLCGEMGYMPGRRQRVVFF